MPRIPRLILTPTPRLARNLSRQHAAAMVAEGHEAWLPPQILSFPAWLTSLRDDYFLAADDDRVPIDAQQALVLWQSLVDKEVFVGEPRVAELAARAWRLIHEHDLTPPEAWTDLWLSEDSRRFRDWAARFRRACAEQGLVDEWAFAAEIPGHLTEGRLELPDSVELAGFERPMTPLQRRIVAALEAAGTEVRRQQGSPESPAVPEVVSVTEPDDELLAAARWARSRLEADPGQRLAVVVPDLSGRLGRVVNRFRQVFDPPGFALTASGTEPWHVSLGEPLADWPLISDALMLLQLDPRRLTQPQARRLLRSPFLPGWTEQGGAQDEALVRLIREAPYDITFSELEWALTHDGASMLPEFLQTWQRFRQENAAPGWPSDWAARFQQELTCLGFGQGRSLDSREYQVLERWHDLLEAFSGLDVVAAAPLGREAALAQLLDRARSAVFREHDPGVPVEILGVEEALGSRFDAVWITTLDSETWPGPVQRDPLIPVPVQSEVRRATSDSCLAHARLELNGLLITAPAVFGSFSRGSDEAVRELTPLLHCPVSEVNTDSPPAPAELETLPDDVQAPALAGDQAPGGTTVLKNQSACPFRAFAEQRLGARELRPPRPGLDAGQRGTIVHQALESFWAGLTDQADLAALDEPALTDRIRGAVATALDKFTARHRLLLTDAGRTLEQRRTERVVRRWLDVELTRDGFAVKQHEQSVRLALGGLALSGKIDRVDELPDGRLMLIDYKTGRTGKGDWFPEARMVDPQLPAYALAGDEPPAAIAFARLRPEDLAFEGLADGDAGTPGVNDLAREGRKFKEIESWGDLMEAWRAHLTALAEDFRAGRAAVDPRHHSVCQRCHLHAFCRIQERAPYESLTEEDGEHADE